ncbi:MAG: co-chaperone DjlA [Candidatus Thiodiazotropha sp. (ex. Lucinisca nassula)]|uniref:co-chaperone DjlA n=1 Tax=Candidatus Thiodiazotropha sp. LNASS1 TaxID=3096260 RepID=UPI000D37B613|nr:co-chaperone DjlA [Candidatus Thiodiazotropha sp. (ex. Lucinisca nassula)]MBW9272494.1 co-chaperone DjlA [Candidatus Thiodiazotropha sp. (ex. Lucinisca nassula)]PUB84227.1 MAG: co-chaperone DjlA [gamma proteobacterium symbiont of Ctena orbiculata]
MSWWGKLVGGAFGFMLGGPLGAVLGAALGHRFDKGLQGLPDEQISWGPGDQERVQTAFFTATFSVMGHLAKADGRVSPDEIKLAEALMAQMSLSSEMRKTAIRLFNEGKAEGFPLDEVVEQFRLECHRRQTLIQMFLEIQIQAAYADNRMDRAEEALLLHICSLLNVSEFTFRRLERMIRAQSHYAGTGRGDRAPSRTQGLSVKDAYDILNITPEATDKEVKRAYRRLISQHHPDKLVSKGLPEEMMKMAAQKTDEIKKAYERVKQARGMA